MLRNARVSALALRRRQVRSIPEQTAPNPNKFLIRLCNPLISHARAYVPAWDTSAWQGGGLLGQGLDSGPVSGQNHGLGRDP